MIHSDHGRHVMTHGIHGVVALMAMHRPVTQLIGNKLNLPHLPHRHVCRYLWPAPRLRCGAAIGSAHLKLMPVNVDGVVGHRQVANPHSDPVPLLHIE